MYFIRIQLTDLLYLYVNNTRSTRTPVIQKSQKMCTFAEIKPPSIRLSPPTNCYLSLHLQKTTTNERNQTTMKKTKLLTQQKMQNGCQFIEKIVRDIIGIFGNVLGAPTIVLGAPSNTLTKSMKLLWPILATEALGHRALGKMKINRAKLAHQSHERISFIVLVVITYYYLV